MKCPGNGEQQGGLPGCPTQLPRQRLFYWDASISTAGTVSLSLVTFLAYGQQTVCHVLQVQHCSRPAFALPSSLASQDTATDHRCGQQSCSMCAMSTHILLSGTVQHVHSLHKLLSAAMSLDGHWKAAAVHRVLACFARPVLPVLPVLPGLPMGL